MARATEVRPRCTLESDIPPETIIDEVKKLLEQNKSVVGKIRDNYIYLYIPEKDQHYWSPEMRVGIKKTEDGLTKASGVVGPNGKVWGTFVVFYIVAISLFLFGGALGISEVMLNIPSLWIWSIPASFLLYALIVIAAKYGQRLGNDQHQRLRYFLDEAFSNAESAVSNDQE